MFAGGEEVGFVVFVVEVEGWDVGEGGIESSGG